ncbi:MAG: hypothetical protein H8E28_14045, partial [Anaerolineae bacterium]|nr:hypothetical protein [Anaerolineae bacterium]
METRKLLGWILVISGLLFLLSGLLVTVFAAVPMPINSNMPQGDDMAASPSMWVDFANQVMDFTLELLALDWTPIRVGVFLIVVGMLLEGFGVYSLLSAK